MTWLALLFGLVSVSVLSLLGLMIRARKRTQEAIAEAYEAARKRNS